MAESLGGNGRSVACRGCRARASDRLARPVAAALAGDSPKGACEAAAPNDGALKADIFSDHVSSMAGGRREIGYWLQ